MINHRSFCKSESTPKSDNKKIVFHSKNIFKLYTKKKILTCNVTYINLLMQNNTTLTKNNHFYAVLLSCHKFFMVTASEINFDYDLIKVISKLVINLVLLFKNSKNVIHYWYYEKESQNWFLIR